MENAMPRKKTVENAGTGVMNQYQRQFKKFMLKEGGGSSGPNRSGRGSGRTTQRSRATYSVTSNNSDGTRGKKTYRQHSMFNRYQPTAAKIRKSTRNLGPRPNR